MKSQSTDNIKEYSTDGKVRHFSTEDDINIKLGKIIGQKFIDYRKVWDAANRMEIVTDFPLFLHLDMNQECNYKCPVGYSGHEKSGLAISYAATALGISSLERHFTIDRTLYGSDQSASVSPEGMARLVGGVRVISKALTGGSKKILDIEKPVADKLRKHIKLS